MPPNRQAIARRANAFVRHWYEGLGAPQSRPPGSPAHLHEASGKPDLEAWLSWNGTPYAASTDLWALLDERLIWAEGRTD